MEKIDCLFINTPKMDSYYKPLGDFILDTYLPMGLLALADLLTRKGFSSRIVHLGVEWILNHDFSILNYLKGKSVKVIAIPLHWHHQAYDAIELAKRIKKNYPRTYIVLGGYTASYFAREILEEFPFIDGIIRGEGEKPILALVRALTRKRTLTRIPNLSWRKGKKIVRNKLSYIATQEDIDRLSFTNFKLLRNYEAYIRYVGFLPFFVKSFSKDANFLMFSYRSLTFPLCTGRGCLANCTYCGGGQDAQKYVNGRQEPVFRSQEKVLESIREAKEYGYQTLLMDFYPSPQSEDYYVTLFRMIREEGIDMECLFGCFALPGAEFAEEFHKTFPGKRSVIWLSLESGVEMVRKKMRGFFYTNGQIIEALDNLNREHISTELYFTFGLPFEEEKDVLRTRKFAFRLKKRFKCIQAIRIYPLEMEPGSPWQRDPESFKVVSNRKTFMDFYKANSRKNPEALNSLGYYMPGFFAKGGNDFEDFERKIQRLKCRHFCLIHPDARKSGPSWLGRLMCRGMSLYQRLKQKRA
jgi:radical SAM superfamily enzyme YgiQ (UPF0313 family)